MEFFEIKELLELAIKKFTINDKYLIDHDVHEQTITTQISSYLKSIITGWHVDTEYNRNGDNPKSLKNIGNIKPDILIHRRGLNNPNKVEDNNLLIIEFKKSPTSSERNYDLEKINAFINEFPYYYKFGAFIELVNSDGGKYFKINWRFRDVNKTIITTVK